MIGKSVAELACLLGGNSVSALPISGFAVDSRKVAPGSIFFALKGDKLDGHDFLSEVALQGAVAAVVSQEYQGEVDGLELIKVEDVLASLHKLAALQVKIKKMRCVAVTGSVGKTTTKEFIATILEGAFSVGKTPGNANSQVGLPLSLLNMTDAPDIFVAELGMSQKGEIAALLPIICPEIVVVTKVALAHALYFPGGLEEVAEAKAEILGHPDTKKIFLNEQVASFAAFKQKQEVMPIFYGWGEEKEGKQVSLLAKENSFVIKTEEGSSREFTLPFSASHLGENFLAAALVAKEFGMDLESIIENAKKLTPYKMRFEKMEKQGVFYINDSYNANPASMKAALENLPKPHLGGKVIAVLGEMKELGIFTEKAHREMGEVASLHANMLFCLGEQCVYMLEEFRKSGKTGFHYFSLDALQEDLKKYVNQGDVVLIKGSNSLKMWQLLS